MDYFFGALVWSLASATMPQSSRRTRRQSNPTSLPRDSHRGEHARTENPAERQRKRKLQPDIRGKRQAPAPPSSTQSVPSSTPPPLIPGRADVMIIRDAYGTGTESVAGSAYDGEDHAASKRVVSLSLLVKVRF